MMAVKRKPLTVTVTPTVPPATMIVYETRKDKEMVIDVVKTLANILDADQYIEHAPPHVKKKLQAVLTGVLERIRSTDILGPIDNTTLSKIATAIVYAVGEELGYDTAKWVADTVAGGLLLLQVPFWPHETAKKIADKVMDILAEKHEIFVDASVRHCDGNVMVKYNGSFLCLDL